MRRFISHDHIDDDVMEERIKKRLRSYEALKRQEPYRYLQNNSESYEWMRADRDMWKSLFMEIMMEERKKKRNEKKNSS